MFPNLMNIISIPIAYLFKSKFYKQSDSVAMARQETSTASEIYIQTHEQTAISSYYVLQKF